MPTPTTTREFLDAAARGDESAVVAWLREGGDVNAAGGEGWTALHYAASRGHVRVLERLADHHDVDLNAATMSGSSALGMALARQSNTMIRLLLLRGASRVCPKPPASAQLEDAVSAAWSQPDVHRMLLPQWSVCWSPALHTKFPPDQREKCRLVVFANTLALRRPASQSLWKLSPSLALALLRGVEDLSAREDAGDADVRADVQRLLPSSSRTHRWVYLPQPLVHRILEFAMFLW
ncbi:hypothetical protein PybrP1_007751 [[Pythium] brassicae (nom. inval.)]|nr:hypothetical protein PybrP1_007751 [[Pythium] brassicae (nom. inval.)]